jgi:predicted DNA-binding transcriptional regulator YafY
MSIKNAMKVFQKRYIEIVIKRILIAGKKCTVAEIADELKVAPRQVFRYLREHDISIADLKSHLEKIR